MYFKEIDFQWTLDLKKIQDYAFKSVWMPWAALVVYGCQTGSYNTNWNKLLSVLLLNETTILAFTKEDFRIFREVLLE